MLVRKNDDDHPALTWQYSRYQPLSIIKKTSGQSHSTYVGLIPIPPYNQAARCGWATLNNRGIQLADQNFKDHFSGSSDAYATYRPTYSIGLADELARISPTRERALDCGCGTGQLSVLLAERFDEVTAIDASASQIRNATPHDRVTYRHAQAEDSGLPDACADLITVAQAAHWLDMEAFYAEARRVARPGAAIALITYGVPHIDGDLDGLIQHFYHETIGPYWPAERRHVEDGYRNLPFPFKETTLLAPALEAQWRLDHLMGYLHTWSAVKAAEQALGTNPARQFAAVLREAWGDPDTRRLVHWPLSIRAGHIP